MSMTTAQANALLDAHLGAGATLLPGTVYIGLLLSSPNPDGSGVVEPSGGSYVRKSVVNDGTQWSAASSRTKTHLNDLIWPTASGNWGNITYVGVFDAASSGAVRLYGPLDVARIINNTDTFRFLAGITPLKFVVP